MCNISKYNIQLLSIEIVSKFFFQDSNQAYSDREMHLSFSINAMPKKSHFTNFAISNFLQNKKKTHVNYMYIVGIMLVR